MSTSLLKTLLLRIISLLIGIIIWIVVMSFANPYTEVKYTIPVKLEISDFLKNNNVEYSVDKSYENINISFMVRNNDLQYVSRSNFEAYASLENMPDDNLLPVVINYKNNIDNYITGVSYNPKSVLIVSEDIKNERFDINYEFTGNKPQNVHINDVYINPKVVYIRGLKNNIDSIDKVLIKIPYNNTIKDYSGTSEIELYDVDNNALDKALFELNTDTVEYNISVYENKVVTFNLNVVGEPPEGCKYTGYLINPQSITISGPHSRVSSINYIDLPEVDVSEFTENTTIVLPISSIINQPIVTPNTGDITILIGIENTNPTSKDSDGADKINNNSNYVPLENEPRPVIDDKNVRSDIIDNKVKNDNENENNRLNISREEDKNNNESIESSSFNNNKTHN